MFLIFISYFEASKSNDMSNKSSKNINLLNNDFFYKENENESTMKYYENDDELPKDNFSNSQRIMLSFNNKTLEDSIPKKYNYFGKEAKKYGYNLKSFKKSKVSNSRKFENSNYHRIKKKEKTYDRFKDVNQDSDYIYHHDDASSFFEHFIKMNTGFHFEPIYFLSHSSSTGINEKFKDTKNICYIFV